MREILTIFMLFFLTACVSKIDNPKEKEALLYTQKFSKDEFVIMGLYLNPIYPEFTSQDSDEIAFCIFPQTKITNVKISNKKAEISNLPKELKLSFATKWSKCFKAYTKSQNLAVLKLSFDFGEHSRQSQALLNFQKLSKSLYLNQKF